MNTLMRIESGGFSIDDCNDIADVKRMFEENRINTIVIPIDSIFSSYPSVTLNEKQTAHIKNGVQVSAPGICDGRKYRVYAGSGEFLCVCECIGGRLRIIKTFWS